MLHDEDRALPVPPPDQWGPVYLFKASDAPWTAEQILAGVPHQLPPCITDGRLMMILHRPFENARGKDADRWQ